MELGVDLGKVVGLAEATALVVELVVVMGKVVD